MALDIDKIAFSTCDVNKLIRRQMLKSRITMGYIMRRLPPPPDVEMELQIDAILNHEKFCSEQHGLHGEYWRLYPSIKYRFVNALQFIANKLESYLDKYRD